MDSKITKLLKVIDEEVKKATKYYNLAKDSAQEIAKTALTSHSQAGDRFHSQGAMEIAKSKLDAVLKLQSEIEKIKGRDKIEFTEAPCYIKTDKTDFYLVNNPVMISGVRLVSTSSDLGKEIINKQVGDVVNEFTILEIE